MISKFQRIYELYIQLSKVVQHATTSNEGNPKLKYLKNISKDWIRMEKHPFILINFLIAVL